MSQPWTLALDTSTVVQVGVARGDEILARRTVDDRMAHVEQLTPSIVEAVADAGVALVDLGSIVVGLGPGPFTGLRVGIVSAQVLGAVRGVPVHGVCSLDILALAHAPQSGEFLVASDARRREVYWARYTGDGVRIGHPQVSAPDELPGLPVIGPAANLYADRLLVAEGPRAIDAGLLAARGAEIPDAGTEPLYLRKPDAAESIRRKSVLRYPVVRADDPPRPGGGPTT